MIVASEMPLASRVPSDHGFFGEEQNPQPHGTRLAKRNLFDRARNRSKFSVSLTKTFQPSAPQVTRC